MIEDEGREMNADVRERIVGNRGKNAHERFPYARVMPVEHPFE